MSLYTSLAFLLVVVVVCINCNDKITPAVQCPGLEFDNLRDRIQVQPCGKTRCRLRKGTSTTVTFKFKPKHEIKTLTNRVFAIIGSLHLPFLGVAETSACNHLTFEDGSPAECPLKADTEYIYTNVFPIQNFYPRTDLTVHWGLHDGKNDAICFEVPATIQ